MEIVFIVIVFFISVIISNIINRMLPRIPLPLIQIVLGIVIGYITENNSIRLNSEVFLALVVAPLLFRDGEEANVPDILKHWKIVAFLAFLVVFIVAFGVGMTAHALLPTIPFGACLAIGAALGPTDVIAMSSLSKQLDFTKRVQAVLKGEGLINDASGIIAFTFAIMALTTGVFHAGNAFIALVLSSIGGALVGVFVAWLNRTVTTFLEEMDAKDITGYLVFEVFLPFLAFFISEEIGVSGIIAAVTAGILQASRFKKITLFDAQLSNVKKSIWQMITFSLNAIVFVFLGIELEQVTMPALLTGEYNDAWIFLAIIILTIAYFAIRFGSLVVYYFVVSHKRKQPFKRYREDMLQVTFAGVKGTVSIATILMTPEVVGQPQGIFLPRALMLFIVAGVTFLSFIVGVVVLPLITPRKVEKKDNFIQIALLEDVVAQLHLEVMGKKERSRMDAAIDNYRARIQELIIDNESSDTKSDIQELRMMILEIERDGLEESYRKKEINERAYHVYARYLYELERDIEHSFVRTTRFMQLIFRRLLSNIFHYLTYFFGNRKEAFRGRAKTSSRTMTHEERRSMREVYAKNTEQILSSLESLEGIYEAQIIDFLQGERIDTMEKIHTRGFINRVIERVQPNNTEEMMRGYYLERKFIFEYEENGLLSKRKAQELRKNVNSLESYSLNEDYSDLPYQLLDFLHRKNS
jgi:CPA1 family monovalent cation:H+ antiporter